MICLYGAEEPYLGESCKDDEEERSGSAKDASTSEQAQLFGPGCGQHHQGDTLYSTIYDDCLDILSGNILNGTLCQGSWAEGACISANRVVPCNESMFSCIHSEAECLDLIEGTRRGSITRVRRRLNEKEKSMIRPGSIFVYKEQESGIRRWTDKREWAPSRVLGVFLAYKDLNGPLYKKTFSKQIFNERYHVVIYSSHEWERNGTCCMVFGKNRVRGCSPLKRCSAYDPLSTSGLSGGSTSIFKFDTYPRQIAGRSHVDQDEAKGLSRCQIAEAGMLQGIEELSQTEAKGLSSHSQQKVE